jgi:hypothetical protein
MVEFQNGRSVGTADEHWPSALLTIAEIVDTLHWSVPRISAGGSIIGANARDSDS